jgi:MFS transporter, DHA2 family, multidrug resistance protein
MAYAEERSADFRTWLGVVGTMLGAFMAIVDIHITNASLRDITGGLGVTSDEGSWLATSYLIGEIVTIPLTAWLTRVFSLRWYLLINTTLFLIFSCCCGLARGLGEMILFRACQGFTGGVLIPMAFTVALSTLPKNKHPIGLVLFGMAATLAPAIGPSAGGWLTSNYGWPWVFYVNLFPGVLTIGSIFFAIRPASLQLNELRDGDWLGIACMAVGLGSLIALLEEGQRDDWFGSQFIQFCTVLAAIFIPAFVLIELVRKKPFVNLRLAATRNLGIASAANFGLGFALYGSVYVLPQYLFTVQGYDALQTGQAMIWVGLPQVLIFPFVPRLMKWLDLRVLVFFGTAVFAFSCWLNTSMTHDYAGEQLAVANVVRALGQPFTIVPLSSLATSFLEPKQVGDGSAIFSIARNLGGSVGTAILETVIIRCEQFYDFEIGQQVNPLRSVVAARLQTLTDTFVSKGYDYSTANLQAWLQVKNMVRREAYVMAFNDAFFVLGISLLVCATLVWFCKRKIRSAT